MYRNCVYKIDKSNKWKGEIHLFTWDENGNPIEKIFPHKSHLLFEHTNGIHKSLFGSTLSFKEFNTVMDRRRWVDSNPDLKIYECLKAEREFLIQYYETKNSDPSFSKYELRTHFLDLEISVESEFPEASLAKYPINLITVYDTYLKEYHTWCATEKESIKLEKNKDAHLYICKTEEELLKEFLRWYVKNIPDVISGWNIIRFDMPYLIRRISKVLDEKAINHLSPIKETYEHSFTPYGHDEIVNTYKIQGVSILDYYLLYKFKFSSGSKESYKLEDIAQEELGYGKLKFEGNFRNFYKQDFDRFVDYNIHDVKLCVELDKKLQFLYLARIICNIGLCEYEAIYNSSPYIYGALILQAHEMGVRLISDDRLDNNEHKSSFTGAHVFDPKAGVYRKGVSTLDFNSLYPNIMITLNISPETKVGKIINEIGEFVEIKDINGNVKKANRQNFKDKLMISANNIVYINPAIKKGIIPTFLEKLYTERKSTRNKMLKKEKEVQHLIEENSDNAKIEEIKKEVAVLNSKQAAYKCFLNSIYGLMGCRFFPLFDIDNAEAVTLSGQHVIKKAAEYLDEYIKEKYNYSQNSFIGGDTDSIAFSCEAIIDKLYPNCKFDKKTIKDICKHLDDVLLADINNHIFEITSSSFLSPLKKIEFKRETFCSEAVFFCKKRYILHIRDKENTQVDKYKYVGVDAKKTELSSYVKNIIKRITEESLTQNWTNLKYQSEMEKIWEQYKNASINDLAFIRGYSTEKTTTGFLSVSKGATIHARAALYYNQIINYLKLKDKYTEIRVGDRIRYIRVKTTNDFNVDVIGWLEDYPEEFEKYFEIDRELMFEKTIISPLQRYEEVFRWNSFSLEQLNSTNIMLL